MRTPRCVSRLAFVAAILTVSATARADEKKACVAASDEAQTLRDQGRYREARAALNACAREACPALVRRQCESWLSELEVSQPTLVLGARDPKGNDVAEARVLLDGAPVLDALEGRPVPVDPGEHVVRYEAPGTVPVEQHIVVLVGEKNRALTASLSPISAPAPALPTPGRSVEVPADSGPSQASVPAAAWVFAGIGGVAAGSLTVFGLEAIHGSNQLRATCEPHCHPSQVDPIRTQAIAADVSLGVGLVSLGIATWLFLNRGTPQGKTTALRAGIEVLPGGAMATLGAQL